MDKNLDDHDLSTNTLVPINDPSDHIIEENNYTIEHTSDGPPVINMPDLSGDLEQPKKLAAATVFPASVADIPLPGEIVDEIPLPLKPKQVNNKDIAVIEPEPPLDTSTTINDSTISISDSNGSDTSCNLQLHVSNEDQDVSMESSAQSVEGLHITGSDDIEEVAIAIATMDTSTAPVEPLIVVDEVVEPVIVEPAIEQEVIIVPTVQDDSTAKITEMVLEEEHVPEQQIAPVLKMEDEEVEEIVGDYSTAPLAVKKITARRGAPKKQTHTDSEFLKQPSPAKPTNQKTLNDITAEAIMGFPVEEDSILPHQTPNTRQTPPPSPPTVVDPPPPKKKQAAIVQQQVVAAADADGKPIYYLETVDEDGVVVMQEAALLVEGEDDDDETEGEVRLVQVEGDDEDEEEVVGVDDGDYQEGENIQLYITSDDISDEMDSQSSTNSKGGRDIIPSHLHGRTVNAPSRDSVKNGKSAPKPRLGVKVPYKNLTSQIVSKAEITEAIMERSMRTSALRAAQSSMQVGSRSSGLNLFSKKMTKRLATKISSGDPDDDEDDPEEVPLTKRKAYQGIKGASGVVGSRVVGGTGNEDLLAILEGNEDERGSRPTPLATLIPSAQTPRILPQQLTAAEERAIALKQLQAIDSDSDNSESEDIRNIQATLKRHEAATGQPAPPRRSTSSRESRDAIREGREAAATLQRQNSSEAVRIAPVGDVTPVKRPRGRPKKIVPQVLVEEEQVIEEVTAPEAVVEEKLKNQQESAQEAAPRTPASSSSPPKNAETPAESPHTTTTRVNSEPEPKFASHVPLKTYARKRKPSETGPAQTGKGEYDFVDDVVNNDKAGEAAVEKELAVKVVKLEEKAIVKVVKLEEKATVKVAKVEEKAKKDDSKATVKEKEKESSRKKDSESKTSSKEMPKSASKEVSKSASRESIKKHQDTPRKTSESSSNKEEKSSKKAEESSKSSKKVVEESTSTKKEEDMKETKTPSKKPPIVEETPAKPKKSDESIVIKPSSKKLVDDSAQTKTPPNKKEDSSISKDKESGSKKEAVAKSSSKMPEKEKVAEKTPTIPPTMHMTKSARVIKKKVIWDPDDAGSPLKPPVKTFSSSASTSSTASSTGSITEKEKEKSTPAKIERKIKSTDSKESKGKSEASAKKIAAEKPEQAKKEAKEPEEENKPQVQEEDTAEEPKISPAKKRKLHEVAKLLKDEGAINMLYSLKSNQGDDAESGNTRASRRNRDILGKASDLYEEMTTISSMDSPKALRKKAGPITHEKKKRLSAAPLMSRKKSGDSYRSSNHSAPTSPQHVGNASFGADASRIIRRRSSSSFGSLEDGQGRDETEEEDEDGDTEEGSIIEMDKDETLKPNAEDTATPDKQPAIQPTTINNNRRKQPPTSAKPPVSPKRQKTALTSDTERAKINAKMSQSFNELVDPQEDEEEEETTTVATVETTPEEDVVEDDEAVDEETIDMAARIKDWEGEVAMENEFVRMTQRENVWRITLVEGDKFDGTLNFEILKQLTTLLTDLETNDKCHVVVLTSTSPSFCTGLNFTTLFNQNEQIALRNSTELAFIIRKFLIALVKFPKPLVGGIRGGLNCGLGCTMLPLFDAIVCADTATFSASAHKLNKSCSLIEGGSLLTGGNLIQHPLVSELLFIGGNLTAAQALRYGLVTRLVWPKNYDTELHRTVCSVANHSLEFLKSTKKQTRHHTIATIVELIKAETDTLIKHWTSPDSQQQFQLLQQQQKQQQNAQTHSQTPS